MLIQLVRIRDTRGDERFHGADQCPECGPIGLCDDIFGDTVSSSVPSSRQLTGNDSVEFDRLRNENSRSFLEFDKPLARLLSPDVALFTLFPLESLSVLLRDLESFKVVGELDFLVEDLLVRVVAVEEIRFWSKAVSVL